jgi:hypothetical protein
MTAFLIRAVVPAVVRAVVPVLEVMPAGYPVDPE